jgi:hypothetical protein
MNDQARACGRIAIAEFFFGGEIHFLSLYRPPPYPGSNGLQLLAALPSHATRSSFRVQLRYYSQGSAMLGWSGHFLSIGGPNGHCQDQVAGVGIAWFCAEARKRGGL